MKKTIFFILFSIVFFSVNIYAQSNHDDSNYKKYEETYNKYFKDWDKKYLTESVSYLNKYLNKYPKDAEAYYNRSSCYESLEKYDNAVSDLTKAITLEPTNTSYYLSRGAIYVGMENQVLALKDYTKAIELDPMNPEYYSDRGWSCYWTMGNYELAIKDISKAIELDPTRKIYYFERGNAYENNLQYDLAILDFSKVIEIDPEWADLYGYRAKCYAKIKDYESAIKDITKLIEAHPDKYWNYYDRSGYYGKLYKYDLALLDLNKVIELVAKDNSYNVLRYYIDERAKLYILNGELSLAIQDYTQSIEKGSIALYLGRSNAYRLLNDYDRAMLDLKLYFEKGQVYYGNEDWNNNGFPLGLYYRGLVYIDKGDYDLAINDLNQSIQLCSNEQTIYLPYWARGKANHLQKNYDIALEDYTKCINIYEKYQDSVYSVSDYREISNVYYSRGTLYTEKDKHNDALKDLDQAISLFSLDADYYYNRGFVHYKLGNKDKAKADWQKAIELNPALKSELEEYLK